MTLLYSGMAVNLIRPIRSSRRESEPLRGNLELRIGYPNELPLEGIFLARRDQSCNDISGRFKDPLVRIIPSDQELANQPLYGKISENFQENLTRSQMYSNNLRREIMFHPERSTDLRVKIRSEQKKEGDMYTYVVVCTDDPVNEKPLTPEEAFGVVRSMKVFYAEHIGEGKKGDPCLRVFTPFPGWERMSTKDLKNIGYISNEKWKFMANETEQ
ncbi:MAG TPA: hypothetical protein VJI75_04310 [Candidatus Nanoarchaeia archaeon]|nr:hypothetical protein [Candidatus Nanoarchaeia archaeon]